ncbi:hypothetical protein LUZ60_001684 [Juncus effusus]|nr:hypothetical protein LUZ60_001684 [Juncus effusus]
MKKTSSFIIPLSVLLLFAAFFVLASMATEGSSAGETEKATVHIVYVDRPAESEPEEFHIRTLASVLGSEEAAKEALIYHYKHAASGFSAKLTPSQVEELKKQPGVLQVLPDQKLQLHKPGAVHRTSVV